ncbi:probable LRR receptor-like serine/threonine-protein kinase At1g67720 isoform X2 [Zingiber officinale]|uniref:probable LRR receptor-like serine/threonine-protein kinase At1g67720 isoform X2 n=1 Tax=Zingiber officinale TaxID=94328 RepID=UPI001C4D9772|nr:probable LRR receptor-like serine/threonine-protein kinase At1g67720 isoform X2 [Zingiber officinale]
MKMEILMLLQVFVFHLLLRFSSSTAQMPGFISLDCGGTDEYIDDTGLEWISDSNMLHSQTAKIAIPSESRKQYMNVRYFPANSNKYCYTLNVETRARYLVRATFLYGNFDQSNVYPKFDIYLGATYWSTIVISDAANIEIEELVLLTSSPTISVCLSNASTGRPFISTLELRRFNGSLYYTTYETDFFLSLSARINFGAGSNDSVRYPDDPFDRIWESDAKRRANFLVDVAPGTEIVSTTMPIDVSTGEMPPEKVMQTAVVGQNGSLTYRLDLDGFPANGWAFSYFAEIEELAFDETRKFKLVVPGMPSYSKATVDVQENAQGKYRLYEPGYTNVSLPFVFSFGFKKTNDSSRGPILNAMEIYRYQQINFGSQDATLMANFVSHYPLANWAQEGGDPCLPASWTWVNCSSDSQPKIISISLSEMNITGNIPTELTKLSGLVEIRLDGNSFTGPVPDFSACINLERIHLENNELTGSLPLSFASLQSLEELYVQNNQLTGVVPQAILEKNIIIDYSGNKDLHKERKGFNHVVIIVFSILGACLLLMVVLICCLFVRKSKKNVSEDNNVNAQPAQKLGTFFSEVSAETAHRFPLSEIEHATGKFEKRIGSGGFGIVYYGKMMDGKEIAVKVLNNDSYQGIREFINEVTLLSRIHHRNLVTFLGYSQQDGTNILVYEFMHNGNLKEHLRGPLIRERTLSWINRLQIAEDAAKGIEYLHTGCSPTIIHRDLKSSNILLDKQMRAKVSDFGLSKPAVDGSHVSSRVRGTVGYLDPEYYTSQQLTEKSDVYSFGIILLELISGQEPISNESFGLNCRNIVAWAKSFIESGNVEAIIDPSLQDDFNLQAMWKIAEISIMCVKPYGSQRPPMTEVLKEIQGAIEIEQGSGHRVSGDHTVREILSKNSADCSGNAVPVELATPEQNVSFPEFFLQPGLR